jgi:hypothetical protein
MNGTLEGEGISCTTDNYVVEVKTVGSSGQQICSATAAAVAVSIS